MRDFTSTVEGESAFPETDPHCGKLQRSNRAGQLILFRAVAVLINSRLPRANYGHGRAIDREAWSQS